MKYTMRMRMIRLFVFFAAVLLMTIRCVVAEDVTLVENGANPWTIYAPAAPAPQEKTAAAELATYLARISGAKFTVKNVSDPAPEKGIFVGHVPGAPAEGLGTDAFRIRVEANRLHIVGGNPLGTLFGVYALLEKLGCRWWSYCEEDVPARVTISLPAGETTATPAFSLHNVWNNEAQTTKGNFYAKSRAASGEKFTGGHTLIPLLATYAQAHPELYPANKKGERRANKTHYCYTATNIAEALAEAIAKEVAKKKGDLKGFIYHAGMGDTGDGMCFCPSCSAIYKEETWINPDGKKKIAYTATLLRMINKTAEILSAQYPGIRVGTFAYMSLEAPPAKTVPATNIIIRLPRLRHCTLHPAETCQKNREYKLNLERWCQLAPGRVYIWEYGASFVNFITPFPCLYSMASNINYYHRLGVRGIEIQGNYVSYGGDLAALKNYTWSRLMWEPTRDPRAVVREFCQGYYGPAAEKMIAYVERLENSVVAPSNVCATEFTSGGTIMSKAGSKEDLRRLAGQALAAAGGREPYDRRVREATVSLDVVELWRAGTLIEQGDRLVPRQAGTDTYERALGMIPYLRGGGVTEWSAGLAAQMQFLTYQGGPLVTFSNGPLTAKIAPVLNGQIRRLVYNGKDLLHVASRDESKRYPHVGGSIESAGTRMMKMSGQPTGSLVRMEGEAGVGLFSPSGDYEVWKTVEMTRDGALVSRIGEKTPEPAKGGAKVKAVKKAGEESERHVSVTTVYVAAPQAPAGEAVPTPPVETKEIAGPQNPGAAELGFDGAGAVDPTVEKQAGAEQPKVALEAKPAPKQPVAKKSGHKPAKATSVDADLLKVPVATQAPGLKVECQNDDGNWQSIEMIDGEDVGGPTSKVWRISLPAQGCAVIDRYECARVTGCKVRFDSTVGTLTTTLRTMGNQISASGEEAHFYQRRIELAPLQARAK